MMHQSDQAAAGRQPRRRFWQRAKRQSVDDDGNVVGQCGERRIRTRARFDAGMGKIFAKADSARLPTPRAQLP